MDGWIVSDGMYYGMRPGQLVRLAFQLTGPKLRFGASVEGGFENASDGRLRANARVLARFADEDDQPCVALRAGDLRFYMEEFDLPDWEVGTLLVLEGQLSIDYYVWAEFYAQRPEAPDLFHTLWLRRIQRRWYKSRTYANREELADLHLRQFPPETPAPEYFEDVQSLHVPTTLSLPPLASTSAEWHSYFLLTLEGRVPGGV